MDLTRRDHPGSGGKLLVGAGRRDAGFKKPMLDLSNIAGQILNLPLH